MSIFCDLEFADGRDDLFSRKKGLVLPPGPMIVYLSDLVYREQGMLRRFIRSELSLYSVILYGTYFVGILQFWLAVH